MEKVVEFKEKRWFQGKTYGAGKESWDHRKKKKEKGKREMKKTGLRILAWILAVLMTVQVMPVQVGAEEAVGGQAAEVSGGALTEEVAPGEARSRVLGEVTENREEEEKHFRMEDGSFVGVNYGVPVHYAQGEEWKDIDNTLVIQENGMRTAAQEEGTEAPRYVAVNGEESRGFAGNLGSGFLFSANTGEEGMEFSLVSPEEEETVPATEAETIPEREAATEGATDPETEGATEAATIPEREAATEGATAPETATEAATVGETEGVEPGVLPEAETAWEAAEQAALTEEPVGEREEVATEPETDPVTGLEEAQEATETAQGEAPEETVPETIAPTTEATEPEETEPETEGQLPYNREAVAQISYPDRKEAAPTGFAGLVASVQNLFRGEAGEEEASLSQQITPTRLRTQVVYEEVYPGVDFQYELYSYHIKETILVKEPLSSGYAFSFRLKLQRLTPELLEDGSVALNKETGERVYWIPAPYMEDGQGACSEAVEYRLTREEEGSWILTVTADRTWMEAEDRVYPVAIDPTLIDQTKSTDFEGTVCTTGMNYIIKDEKFACGYHGDYGQMEVFFRLNQYPDIPEGHTLVRAYAGLYQNDWRSGVDNKYDGSAILYMQANTEN